MTKINDPENAESNDVYEKRFNRDSRLLSDLCV